MDTERPLRIDLLGEMADAPSSFAATYGSLIRNAGYTNLKVSRLIEALEQLKRSGLVRADQMCPDGSWRTPTEEDRRNDRAAMKSGFRLRIGVTHASFLSMRLDYGTNSRTRVGLNGTTAPVKRIASTGR